MEEYEIVDVEVGSPQKGFDPGLGATVCLVVGMVADAVKTVAQCAAAVLISEIKEGAK